MRDWLFVCSVLLVVVVVGCKPARARDAGAGSAMVVVRPDAGPCDTVVDHTIDVVDRVSGGVPSGPNVRAVMLKNCIDQQWSEADRKCLLLAEDPLALMACGVAEDPKAPANAPGVTRYEALADEVCACKSAVDPCGSTVETHIADVDKALGENKWLPADAAKIRAALDRGGACLRKAMTAPPTPGLRDAG